MNLPSMLRKLFKFSDWPVRYKEMLALLAAALLPLALFVIASSINSYNDAIDNVRVDLAQAAQASGTLIQQSLDSAISEVYNNSQELRLAAQVLFHARTLNDNPQYEGETTLLSRTLVVLEEQLVRHPNYQSIRLVSPDGRLLAQSGDTTATPGITASLQNQVPAYLALTALTPDAGHAVLIPPYQDPVSGELLLEVSTFVLEAQGDILQGYLIFTLKPQDLLLRPLLSEQATARAVEQDRYLFLVDRDGWLLTPVRSREPFSTQVTVTAEGAGPDTYERNWGGGPVSVIGRQYTLTEYGWTVFAEISRQAIAQPIVRDLIATSAPILAAVIVLVGFLVLLINRQLVGPIVRLTRVAQQAASGDLSASIPPLGRSDEIGQLNQAVETMTENLRSSIEDLELRVRRRTRDLEMSTIIAREASMLEDVQTLLDDTVNLIVKNFNSVYHAQVFLIDESGEYASLIASTGEPGRQLLARGHRLAVGSVSVIGRVTELGQTVVARDTSTSRVHRRNEFLPDTRAEMALPLMRGERIIGALDVQSTRPDAFRPDEQAIFETLAAQLAVAIDNARRFEQANRLAREAENLNRRMTRTEWKQLLSAARRPGHIAATAGATEDDVPGWSEWQQQAAQQHDLVVSPPGEDGMCFLAMPILSRGEVLGVIEWQMEVSRVTTNIRQMARELAARLATTMETVRLLERSERLAERERLVNEISGRLTSEPNVDLILQTAVQQLADVLQTSQVNIRLKQPTAAAGSAPTENA